jgi:hypothetical protein
MGQLLDALVERHGRCVVLDLHSYNHRRAGPSAPADDPRRSPDINIGTGNVDSSWRPLIDRALLVAASGVVDGTPLNVGENVRFRGGYFPRWVNARYGTLGCALAIEVKKIFMDEWTGRPYPEHLGAITELMFRLGGAMGAALEER